MLGLHNAELYTPPSTALIIYRLVLAPLQSPVINIYFIVNHLCQPVVIRDN